MIQLLRKYPEFSLLVCLGVTQLSWFWLAPGNFKTVWAQNILVAHIIKEHALVEEKSKIVTVSYYNPYFDYFADIAAGTQQPNKAWMEGYYFGRPYIFHTYYHKAVDLFPNIDAVHYLLGFCEYYMGNPDVARVQYEKSMELNPYFFWSDYNLGVIYFQQGDFFKSAVVLSKAISLRKEISLAILRQSPFYRQIWRSIANPPQILGKNLIEGQADAALLLATCFVKAHMEPQALQIIQSIGKDSPWHRELWKELYKKASNKQALTDVFDHSIQEQIPVRLF